MTQRALTRQTNYDKRNQRIRDAYYKRFTLQPKPRIYTREGIIAQLAEEYCLSMATVEDIIRIKHT